MGFSKEIYSLVETYSSLIVMGVIAVADILWEDEYFTCPCVKRPQRIVFCLSFIFSPINFMILADSNCSVLCVTCKNLVCDGFHRRRSAFSRPFNLAVAWTIYSIMNPRFSECIENERFHESNQTFSCTLEDQRASELKYLIATGILITSVIAIFIKMVWGCCAGCSLYDSNKSSLRQKLLLKTFPALFRPNKHETLVEEDVEKSLKALLTDEKLTGQTLVALKEEDLWNTQYFNTFEDSYFKKLESKINMGQMMIIKKYYKKESPKQDSAHTAAGSSQSDSTELNEIKKIETDQKEGASSSVI